MDAPKTTRLAFMVIGAAAILLAVLFASTTLSFIGLGLCFWGAILAYVQTEEGVKSVVLDDSTPSTIEGMNQLKEALGLVGKPIYLPPKYFSKNEAALVYVPRDRQTQLPNQEQIALQEKGEASAITPHGFLMTPPGEGLLRLLERVSETDFIRLNPLQLGERLAETIVDKLDMAEAIETRVEKDKVVIVVTKPVCLNLYLLDSTIDNRLEPPMTSALASAFTKSLGTPLIVEKTGNTSEGLEIEMRLLRGGSV